MDLPNWGWFPHSASVFAFVGQLLGYVALSTALQVRYYHLQAGREERWKVQPKQRDSSSCGSKWEWWLPAIALVCERPGTAQRHPCHALFSSINLLLSSAFMAFVVESSCRGWSNLGSDARLTLSGGPLLRACAAQTVIEYYWHRLMHWPPAYKTLHKLHHHYKSPQPFDDLFIHPLEAFGYYLILYVLPIFCLGPMPTGDFAVYMALHGLCGVLDHSGVALSLPPFYRVADHDAHHKHFNVNYGFPTILMDLLHGTDAHSHLNADMARRKVSQQPARSAS